MKRLLPILFFLFITSSVFAQLAQLTNETFNAGIVGAKPNRLTKFGNKMLFLAVNADYGREIWITDGTAAGTKLVKDINVGVADLSTSAFAIMGNKAYFCAQVDIGYQLWVTDGTTAGTKPVMSRTFTSAFNPVSDGTKMFFITDHINALNNILSIDVWKSDGTDSGTTLVEEEIAVVNGGAENLSFYNGLFVFTIVDPDDTRTKLWRSDGTEEGTFPVIGGFDGDGSHGNGTSHPSRFLEYNGKLYFVIRDGSNFNPSVGLVKTDGTVAGTTYLKAMYAGNSNIIEFGEGFVYNNKMYFTFFDADTYRYFIYESDGTEANTTMIYDHTFASYFTPSPVVIRDNYFFFTGGVDSGTGVTLMRLNPTDKTSTTIKKLADTATKPFFFLPKNANILSGPASDGTFLIGVAGTNTGFDRWTLWTSDGTAANTTALDKTCSIATTVVMGDRVYSPAITTADGEQLWAFNTTSAQLKIPNSGEIGASTRNLVVNGNKLFSLARDKDLGYEPWTTDGTVAGSHIIADLATGNISSNPREIVPFGSGFAFLGYVQTSGNDWTIAKSDGTANGTAAIHKVIYPDYPWTMFANSDNTAVYINSQILTEGPLRYRISRLNQNETEPKGIIDLGLTSDVFAIKLVGWANAGAKTFLVTKGDFGGGGLWITDGTIAGSKFLKEHWAASELAVVDNKAYYLAYDDENDFYPNLMVSDGTESGTTIVKSLDDLDVYAASTLTAFGNKLVFAGTSTEKGKELYISDGTSTGTKLLKDLSTGDASGFRSSSIEVLGDSFYFAGDNGTTGIELYKSNGTADGTVLLKDIYAGSESSSPQYLKALNGKLYFSALTAENGVEVWSTDGTAEKTKLLVDAVPGAANGNPNGFVMLNDYLLFFALTPANGRQVLSFKPSPEVDEVTGLEDEKSSFTVYPNPSTGLFHIKSDLANAMIEVYSSDGRKIHRDLLDNDSSVDLRNSSDGVYIIRVTNNVKTYSTKVLKR